MTNIKKHSATALATAILTVALTIPVTAIEAPAESIRISSYKGSTLEVGERSGLIIGPSGTEYTVTSSAPDIVAMEQVLFSLSAHLFRHIGCLKNRQFPSALLAVE